jgi:integrase
MPTQAFTARWLDAVKPPKAGQVDYFDSHKLGKGRSFGLRVSYGGDKAFFVMYRRDGKLKRLTIGKFPHELKTLQAARKEADRQLNAILSGGDPAKEKQERKDAATVAELCDEYIERYARRHKKSWERDRAVLNRDIVPRWGDRKARDITRRDVLALLEDIIERGAPLQANRTFEIVRKMFNWAVEREIAEINPCWQIKKPSKEHQRDRVLTDDEIRALWSGLDGTGLSEQVRLVLKLILVTAQRKGEIVAAQRPEFDLDSGVWTIPAERSKNGLSHRVPLSPLARSLVDQAFQSAGRSRFLFPSGAKDSPILDTAVDRAVRRNIGKLDIPHFTPHDLRRTAASGMASMGIPRLVIGKILNHADQGVTATYDRHGYDSEKRQALQAWGAHLQGLLRTRARKQA